MPTQLNLGISFSVTVLRFFAITDPEPQYDPMYMLTLSQLHIVSYVLYYICVWADGLNAINDELMCTSDI